MWGVRLAECRMDRVENVPAYVCTKCGEKSYSPEVTDQLLKFTRHELEPIRPIEVPVFDYAEMP